jgi:hypothetical protein
MHGEMKAHVAFAHAEHINQPLDGENQHGNCEEIGEEGGTAQEGGTA